MRKLVFFTLGFALSMALLATDYNKILLLLVTGIVTACVYWRLELKHGKKSLAWVSLGAVLGFGYFTGYSSFFYQPLEEYYGETLYIEAVVTDFPSYGSYSYSVMVEVYLPKGKVQTLLYMDDQAADLKVGDRIWTSVELRSSEETFHGEKITYYVAKGIMLRGIASGELVIQRADSISLRHYPAYLAQWLKEGIETVYPPRYQGIVLALVTGNREGLSDAYATSLDRTGLSHTVAVSGMHLAFLAGLLRFLLPSKRWWSSCLVMAIMVLFMLVSGSTPSIIRATVMIIMLQLAPLFGRERDDSTALAAALLLILLQNPFAVNHVGLHLSVASVAGILLFSNKIQEKFIALWSLNWEYKTNPVAKFLISGVSATLGAMIITTIMVAYYFGSISLISPVSNLLTLSAVSLSFAGGLVTGMVGGVFPVLGQFLSLPLIPILEYLQWIVTKLSHSTLASITMDSIYYQVWLVFVYVILGIYLLTKGKKSGIIPSCCCILSFFLVFFLHRFHYFQQDLSMEVFDVGQGQTILFTLGDTFIVSDCGGSSYENTGDMVADRVQSVGKNKIELLVLSHCHGDHANGVMQLLERLHVEVIAMPLCDIENSLQDEIVAKARETETEVWFIEEETHILITEHQEIVLYPPVGSGDLNEEGITLLVSCGQEDILITGDMDMKTEALLMEQFPLPDIEIFVVGHHGSKYSTSEAFLQSIQAEIAVISVSSTNNYGHPTQEVLDKLERMDMEIYRTDQCGTIRFTTAS